MGRQCAHKRDIPYWSRPALFHPNRADRRAIAREPSSPAKGPGGCCLHLRTSLYGTPPSPSQEEGQRAPKGDFSSRETGLPPLVPTGQMSGRPAPQKAPATAPVRLKVLPCLEPLLPLTEELPHPRRTAGRHTLKERLLRQQGRWTGARTGPLHKKAPATVFPRLGIFLPQRLLHPRKGP